MKKRTHKRYEFHWDKCWVKARLRRRRGQMWLSCKWSDGKASTVMGSDATFRTIESWKRTSGWSKVT